METSIYQGPEARALLRKHVIRLQLLTTRFSEPFLATGFFFLGHFGFYCTSRQREQSRFCCRGCPRSLVAIPYDSHRLTSRGRCTSLRKHEGASFLYTCGSRYEDAIATRSRSDEEWAEKKKLGLIRRPAWRAVEREASASSRRGPRNRAPHPRMACI